MTKSLQSSVAMNNGVHIPIFGLGTWDMYKKTLEQAIEWALAIGYRHFDTATYYHNEQELGTTLKNSGLARNEYFITTKVYPADFGYEKTKNALKTSLEKLQTEFVDQYLIHWPKDKQSTNESWKALVEMYQQQLCRSIGVSNYSIKQLEDLKGISDIIPATNQIELHPFVYKQDILDYCKSEGIIMVSYSPLVEGKRLKDPRLQPIAAKYNKTPAQILLRWGLEQDTVVIPKSSNKNRLQENISIFDFKLTPEDMQILNSFN